MVKTIINEEVILSYPDGFERKKVSGRNANGFTYEYVLEGAAQIGEVLVFQNVNCF
jgi:hypothetical protein